MGILAGCSNSGSPTGDAQMEKYEENAAKAEKLGGGDAAGNDGAQAEGETSGE